MTFNKFYGNCKVLQGKKAEYGKNIIGDLSERLTAEYGKGFEKSSVFKMVKFYQEFPKYEKVATLSQQLTVLRNEGLVDVRKSGRYNYYRVSDERVKAVLDLMYQFFCQKEN